MQVVPESGRNIHHLASCSCVHWQVLRMLCIYHSRQLFLLTLSAPSCTGMVSVVFMYLMVKCTEWDISARGITSSCSSGLIIKSVSQSVTRGIGKPLSMSVRVFTMMRAHPLWNRDSHMPTMASRNKTLLVSVLGAFSVRLLRRETKWSYKVRLTSMINPNSPAHIELFSLHEPNLIRQCCKTDLNNLIVWQYLIYRS